MKKKIFLCLFLFTSTALADWSKVASKEFSLKDYPEEGSKAYQADFATLLKYQQDRDDQDCKLALRQRYPDFQAFFGKSADLFSADELATVEPLLKRVTKLGDRISGYFKDKFERPRPYNVDARIKPCAEEPAGAKAYPSSHAAVAALDACVLAELFPKRAKKIKEYGKYLGDLRMITGVHHPSDVVAGQGLAKDICDHLLADEEFQAELEEVKEAL